jgi:hypothetical protein
LAVLELHHFDNHCLPLALTDALGESVAEIGALFTTSVSSATSVASNTPPTETMFARLRSFASFWMLVLLAACRIEQLAASECGKYKLSLRSDSSPPNRSESVHRLSALRQNRSEDPLMAHREAVEERQLEDSLSKFRFVFQIVDVHGGQGLERCLFATHGDGSSRKWVWSHISSLLFNALLGTLDWFSQNS